MDDTTRRLTERTRYDSTELERVGLTPQQIVRHFFFDIGNDSFIPIGEIDMGMVRGARPISAVIPNPRDERETERPTIVRREGYSNPVVVDPRTTTTTDGTRAEMERAWRDARRHDAVTFHGIPVVFNPTMENPVDDRYTITPKGQGMVRITGKDGPQIAASDVKALAAATAVPELPTHLKAQAIRTQRGKELTQRLLARIEVLLDMGGDLPPDITQTAKELTALLGDTGLGYHRVLKPGALEVVNDPQLHAKAMAEAMRKENALAAIPDTDPMHYDPEAVASYAERAQGQMDAIEAAYQDGFAMGQRDMAEQLGKLGTVALLKAKLRQFLGRPAAIVEDSGVESAMEPEVSAPERERGEVLYQDLADREDLTLRGIHLEPPK